ncbi:YqiA/YcfP family alpha/beta fold hydrolase [Methylomarinum vadi]|uniref:YqiA/YcfP family alpha/beta fold hydrolase n=1 Tax=Methylomarinum vadi TaxID=438855 RepID=UPI0004DF223F|nr:YqiA/YcfP family alpha/beta fold hydrolase [Methylomarinum vadi]
MKKKAIIYLHGFNSASLDLEGNLLINKDKLLVMQEFCTQKDIVFDAPNVDYRDFQNIVEDLLLQWNQYLDQGHDVIFMGSSMGGFSSEYLAMKTGACAIMINPAITPSELLPQFIGVNENFETGQPYHWEQEHCDQYWQYEQELANSQRAVDRTVLLDMADELLDAEKTLAKYKNIARVVAYEGGSHGFEHMRQALPVIEQVVFSGA